MSKTVAIVVFPPNSVRHTASGYLRLLRSRTGASSLATGRCLILNGFKHKPDSTFGTVNADVLVDSEPGFKPMNFVEIIRKSPWVA